MSDDRCRCWSWNGALGHDGHCCFLRDDRDRSVNGGFKDDESTCHIPTSTRGQ